MKELLNVFGRGWVSVEGTVEEQGQGIERGGVSHCAKSFWRINLLLLPRT